MKTKIEDDRFEELAKAVLSVPNGKVKAGSDAERTAKKTEES